jgi:hypothetical protein
MKWAKGTGQYGIDIFMTTTALLNGFKSGQVVLGSKVHKPSAPKLGPMFSQVISTLFESICRFKDWWVAKEGIKKSLVFGEGNYYEPQAISIDYKKLKKESLKGFSRMEGIITDILTPSCCYEVKRMYNRKRWNIGSGLWSKILYDFIYAYEKRRDKETIIEALKPLYFARAASFYRQTMELDHLGAERKILRQARQFQKNRDLLIEKYEHGEQLLK